MHRAAVNVRTEKGSFFVQPHQIGERENLKSATVGQDRSIPTEKPVQSAEIMDNLFTGSKRKMIGITQNHFGTSLFELSDFDPFDGSERSDGHKRREFDGSVSRLESPSPGVAAIVLMDECVHGRLKLFFVFSFVSAESIS